MSDRSFLECRSLDFDDAGFVECFNLDSRIRVVFLLRFFRSRGRFPSRDDDPCREGLQCPGQQLDVTVPDAGRFRLRHVNARRHRVSILRHLDARRGTDRDRQRHQPREPARTRDHPRLLPFGRDIGCHAHRPPGALDEGSPGHRREAPGERRQHRRDRAPVDASTAAGKAFLDMLGVLADVRIQPPPPAASEGISAARRRSACHGRPPKIDMDAIRAGIAEGRSPTGIAREMGISRGTVCKAKAGMPGKAVQGPLEIREDPVPQASRTPRSVRCVFLKMPKYAALMSPFHRMLGVRLSQNTECIRQCQFNGATDETRPSRRVSFGNAALGRPPVDKEPFKDLLSGHQEQRRQSGWNVISEASSTACSTLIRFG